MRIVLATWGSFGDLHPFLALGEGLLARGHDVVVATCPLYQGKVERSGLGFAPLGPDLPPPGSVAAATMARLMDARHGPRAVLRETVVPAVEGQYRDLCAACAGADRLVAHPVVLSAPLAAAKKDVPLVGLALQPILFLSAHDPCVPPGVPALVDAWLPPQPLMAPMLRAVRGYLRRWTVPVDRLRSAENLPDQGHPLFEAPFSGVANIAAWDPVLGAPQPDWPSRTVQTGFLFHDRRGEPGDASQLPERAEEFLAGGPAPVCFTLGTSAVMDPGFFWDAAAAACRQLGIRGIFLTGLHPGAWQPDPADTSLLALDYAPHSLLMPRCAAVVHQGGVGTTGQALRSGRPQVVVPWSHDQPDHARRVVRAGLGAHVARHRIGASAFADVLERVLGDASIAENARRVGDTVRARDGVGVACDAVVAA